MQNLLKYVSSFTDGRIRLRHPALERGDIITELQERISGVPGVRQAEFNSRTGSLLLLYDPQVLSREALIQHGLSWIKEFEARAAVPPKKPSETPRRASSNNRQTINRGMLAFFAFTVLSCGFGAKALHFAMGSMLTLLVMVHTTQHWNAL